MAAQPALCPMLQAHGWKPAMVRQLLGQGLAFLSVFYVRFLRTLVFPVFVSTPSRLGLLAHSRQPAVFQWLRTAALPILLPHCACHAAAAATLCCAGRPLSRLPHSPTPLSCSFWVYDSLHCTHAALPRAKVARPQKVTDSFSFTLLTSTAGIYDVAHTLLAHSALLCCTHES
jgi:hypothetical protein